MPTFATFHAGLFFKKLHRRTTFRFLEVIVGWKFKQIVDFDRIKLFNSINLRLDYPVIDIRSPLEVIDHKISI